MKYKTLAEIQALTLETTFPEVISRIVDIGRVPIGVLFYELSADQSKSLYERIILHDSIPKPSQEVVEQEFNLYKQELIDGFDAKKSFNDRLEALGDLRILKDRIGDKEPNLEAWKLDLLERNDLATLDLLEAESVAYAPIASEETEINLALKDGKKSKEACDDCLHLVRGFNKSSGMTKQQIKALKVTFADILDDLKDGMPNEARILIEAVDLVPFLPLRNKLLKVLERHGF